MPAKSYAAETPAASVTTQVFLVPPNCTEDTFALATFLDSLRVELAGSKLQCCSLADATPIFSESPFVQVQIEELGPCGGDAEHVRIAARQSGSFRMLEREMTLADVAHSARPRTLALAVAELIRSLTEETRDTPEQQIPIVQQRSLPQSARIEPTDVPNVDYAVQSEGEIRVFPKRHTTQLGGRARLTARSSAIYVAADLGANFSNVSTTLGDVYVRSASIGFGAGPRLVSTPVALEFGPRVEFGWAWIRGSSSKMNVGTDSGSGPIASIGFRTSLEAHLHPTILPYVGVEIGGILQGMNGNVDSKIATGLGGYYFLAATGLNLRL